MATQNVQGPINEHKNKTISESGPLTVDTSLQSSVNIGSRYVELQAIGCGGNGLVFSAIDSDCDKKVAIKRLNFQNSNSCKYALREIRLTHTLRHENIIRIHEILAPGGISVGGDAHSCPADHELDSVFLVQDYMDADLHRVIQTGQLTAEHCQLLMYQLLCGVEYIHSANVLHRDLKPSNLLINTDTLTLKIADFGLARVVDPAYSHKGHLTENIGTCWYRSPEQLLTPADYTKAIDIWSCGCIFAEMLIGRPLFPGGHDLDQVVLILDAVVLEDADWYTVLHSLPNKVLKNHPTKPRCPLYRKLSTVSSKALCLIEDMLTFNPVHRVTAEDALCFPYFKPYHCLAAKNIAPVPFRIESEVDNLSPTSIKEMIWEEGTAISLRYASLDSLEALTVNNANNEEEESQEDIDKMVQMRNAVNCCDNHHSLHQNPSVSRGSHWILHQPDMEIQAKQPPLLDLNLLCIDVEESENAKEFHDLSPKQSGGHHKPKSDEKEMKLEQKSFSGKLPSIWDIAERSLKTLTPPGSQNEDQAMDSDRPSSGCNSPCGGDTATAADLHCNHCQYANRITKPEAQGKYDSSVVEHNEQFESHGGGKSVMQPKMEKLLIDYKDFHLKKDHFINMKDSYNKREKLKQECITDQKKWQLDKLQTEKKKEEANEDVLKRSQQSISNEPILLHNQSDQFMQNVSSNTDQSDHSQNLQTPDCGQSEELIEQQQKINDVSKIPVVRSWNNLSMSLNSEPSSCIDIDWSSQSLCNCSSNVEQNTTNQRHRRSPYPALSGENHFIGSQSLPATESMFLGPSDFNFKEQALNSGGARPKRPSLKH